MSDIQAAAAPTQRAKVARLSPEISEFVSMLSALEHQAQDKAESAEKRR